jgi:hypothetical protein
VSESCLAQPRIGDAGSGNNRLGEKRHCDGQ